MRKKRSGLTLNAQNLRKNMTREEIKATVDYILSKSGEAEYDESIDAGVVPLPITENR